MSPRPAATSSVMPSGYPFSFEQVRHDVDVFLLGQRARCVARHRRLDRREHRQERGIGECLGESLARQHRRRSSLAMAGDAVRFEHRGAARRLRTGVDALVGRLVLRRHDVGSTDRHDRKKQKTARRTRTLHRCRPGAPRVYRRPDCARSVGGSNQDLQMKLVEEYAGVGDLSGPGEVLQAGALQDREVPGILRRQRLTDSWTAPDRRSDRSSARTRTSPDLVGTPLVLRLEDGRALCVTLADTPRPGACPRATVLRDASAADSCQ